MKAIKRIRVKTLHLTVRTKLIIDAEKLKKGAGGFVKVVKEVVGKPRVTEKIRIKTIDLNELVSTFLTTVLNKVAAKIGEDTSNDSMPR